MERRNAVVVWAVWGGLTALALGYVAWFGGRIPWMDDYWYLPSQLDPAVPSVGYLWGQLNEHRVPLPKLAAWAVAQVGGYSLRTQMRVNALLLALAAAVYLRAARRVRGRTALADVFFPLVVLTPGVWENLLLGVQLNFTLPAVLQACAVSLVAGTRDRPSGRRAAAAGLVAVLLPLNGAQGLVPGAALSVWLLLCGRTAGLAGLAVVVAYFVGYEKPAGTATSHDFWLEVRYFVRLVGGAWGPVTEAVGPAEPTRWPTAFGVGTGLFLGWSVWALASRGRAAVGLGLLAGGFLLLTAATAYGRAVPMNGGLANRYHALTVPLLAVAYLSWVRLKPAAVWPTGGLAVTALLVAGPNLQLALTAGFHHHVRMTLFERDILCGVPAPFLEAHHGAALLGPQFDGVVTDAMERLKAAGRQPFAQIAVARPLADGSPLTVRPVVGVAGPDGWVTADDLGLVVLTVEPGAAVAVDITYEVRGDPADSEARWTAAGPDGTPASRLVAGALAGRGRLWLWLGDGAAGLRLVLRGAGAVRVTRAVGLVSVNPH